MRTNKSVRGLIIKDNKVLLIHRFKNGDEYWVVPGGGVEDEESLEEALRREMMEETGLSVLEFELLKTTIIGEVTHHIYRCKMSDGEPKIGGPEAESQNENNQYILTWVPISEVDQCQSLYPDLVETLIKNK